MFSMHTAMQCFWTICGQVGWLVGWLVGHQLAICCPNWGGGVGNSYIGRKDISILSTLPQTTKTVQACKTATTLEIILGGQGGQGGQGQVIWKCQSVTDVFWFFRSGLFTKRFGMSWGIGMSSLCEQWSPPRRPSETHTVTHCVISTKEGITSPHLTGSTQGLSRLSNSSLRLSNSSLRVLVNITKSKS